MEYILAREVELDKRLKEKFLDWVSDIDKASPSHEHKRHLAGSGRLFNLAEIKSADDLGAAVHERKIKAHERNLRFLQELDNEIGKLHTKRLCPMNEKLAAKKANFFRSIQPPQQQHHHS